MGIPQETDVWRAEARADDELDVRSSPIRRILDQATRSSAPVVVIEAIKLLEGPLVDHVDAVWVVTTPRETRIERLVQERGMTREDAERRVDAQNPEEEKVRAANVVIHNDGSLEHMRDQVDAAWLLVQKSS